jgi:hypothetical protein
LRPETQKDYTALLEKLWHLEPATVDSSPEPVVRKLTPEGKTAFVKWTNKHYKELSSKELYEDLRGPYAKMDGICASLALILHEVWCAWKEKQEESIDEQSVKGAIKLANYFKKHAGMVYKRLQISAEEKRINQALAWLKRHGDTATLRDFVTYKVAGCKTSTAARRLFQELEILGHGAITATTPANGGPTSYVFCLKEP